MTTRLACSLCGTAVEPAPGGVWAVGNVCPGCKLRTRHRAVGAYMGLFLDLEQYKTIYVCHATPEERKFLFGRDRSVVNFDIRPTKATDTILDIQDMATVATGSVDLFVVVHVLNHVADDVRAISEIQRVLKPGTGVMVATVPFRRSLPTEPIADVTVPYGPEALAEFGVGSFRRYGLSDFRNLLEGGFALTEYRFADSLVNETETVFQGRRLAA